MSTAGGNATMSMMPSTMPPSMAALDTARWVARNVLYAKEIWWFLTGVIGLIAAGQFVSWGLKRLFTPCPPPPSEKLGTEGQGVAPARRFSWSHLPVALVNYFRVIAFRNTVNVGEKYTFTYLEVFLTLGYIVAIFTWEFINTTDLAGSALSFTYWSGRAGALAVSQFPLITALGTKNSLIAYITGVSYDKLNFIHRMMARVVFILLWVHAGSKIAHLPPAFWATWWIRLGLTAIIAFTILNLVAYRPIRARFYEAFFFTHFFMVLILLIGAYYHARHFSTLYVYVWPSFLIWGLDRSLRFFRLVYFNNYFSSSARQPPMGCSASVELLSAQFVRLRFARPPQLKWTPGQAAFLIMPGVSTVPFEAHPFTIAAVDSRYRLRGKPMERMDSMATLSDRSDVHGMPAWEDMEFMINVREGFTKRLGQAAERGQRVKVFVDGPYGFSPNLRDDDTVVLVAGGSGISLVLSMFLGLVSDVQNGRTRCRKVVFIWSIRDSKQLDWIADAVGNALEVAPEHLDISIRIFMTGRARVPDQTPLMDGDDGNSSGDEMMTPTDMEMRRPLLSFAAVSLTHGRPDLAKLLKEEVSNTNGRISVTVCGSQAIAQSCRAALRFPLGQFMRGGASVVLHVESFGYA